MKGARIFAATAIFSLLVPVPAAARQEIFVTLKPGTPLTIQPDRGYILFRMVRKVGIS
ncbi:hypothetical protein [Sphingomonas sp.]|uniref:hypothetical protein n=1 Tax=Sphingomonas sp. TaxID=28214 RepID=UPI002E3410AF|nr:hypothetical protein [Sphingomonas sp.]HEX4694169.1 hypothetical protein [Sphingomonas sp.]